MYVQQDERTAYCRCELSSLPPSAESPHGDRLGVSVLPLHAALLPGEGDIKQGDDQWKANKKYRRNKDS
jgi:hypothetical protein